MEPVRAHGTRQGFGQEFGGSGHPVQVSRIDALLPATVGFADDRAVALDREFGRFFCVGFA